MEANECGVPTVSLDFGESVYDEIIDGKTGYIAQNSLEFEKRLKELMDDDDKLKTLAKNCKEFSNNFKIDNIIKEWIKLFKEIDS